MISKITENIPNKTRARGPLRKMCFSSKMSSFTFTVPFHTLNFDLYERRYNTELLNIYKPWKVNHVSFCMCLLRTIELIIKEPWRFVGRLRSRKTESLLIALEIKSLANMYKYGRREWYYLRLDIPTYQFINNKMFQFWSGKATRIYSRTVWD